MKIFIGLCGRMMQGLNSSSRGEGRWALNLARCLKDYGHDIVMAPDIEMCDWGDCPKPPNVEMIQSHRKILFRDTCFDAAIFTSWSTERTEMQFINARKYLWGVFGWKTSVMTNGYFQDYDYVIRYSRDDLEQIPYPIDFKDRVRLLVQPFGKEFGAPKFENKRIAWVAKEAFLPEMNPLYAEAAKRHFYAMVDACKETGCGISVFNGADLDRRRAPRITEMKIFEKLKEVPDVKIFFSLPYNQYHEELNKCSITVPFCFHASTHEAVFNGLVPMLYQDSALATHSWIKGVPNDMTRNKFSRMGDPTDLKSILSESEIKDILVNLLTNKVYFNECLCRLRPMVVDNIDDHVAYQFDEIMKHKGR